MSVRRLGRARATAVLAALATVSCLSLTACSSGSDDPQGDGGSGGDTAAGSGSGDTAADDGGSQQVDDDGSSGDDAASPVFSTNVGKGASDVPVSTLVEVGVDGGTLSSVTVSSSEGEVAGELNDDGSSWTASERLEPGTTYKVVSVADNDSGEAKERMRFTTADLSLDQQIYPSVAPLDGETVGVGMPVIVTFDLPVTDRKAFEKNMSVTSEPAQQGSWHWLSDNEAHWRPKTYWRPGTKVHVDVDVNGVDAGNGLYGQEDREIDFTTGDAHIYQVDADTHQMKVFSNGKLLRTIPITTGEEPDYTTRSGVKVIVEKFESKRMNSETVGITGSEAYDIDNVQYAMRLTYSGEFIHAAPWSVASQGNANVSHGCTGMSTENAAWLYQMTRRGDVVEYTGTDKPMTLDNGYGDWNASFKNYEQGSALA
ncbi:Ig-like domain-containing protein [Nocardioides marinquilinus]|uniref:Ig-like domain-containing protein n=1 Tax=Nocardioides marinquilinus TaxID=1210400 RepID=A0ABP9PV48_9ACTN